MINSTASQRNRLFKEKVKKILNSDFITTLNECDTDEQRVDLINDVIKEITVIRTDIELELLTAIIDGLTSR